MNPFALIGLLIGFSSTAISVMVVMKGKRKLHYIWAAFILGVAIWGFGSYKVATTFAIDPSIFWWKISYIGVIFIPVLFTHFTIEFLSLKKRLLIIFYLLSTIFLFFNLFTDLFIKRVRYIFGFYYISPPEVLYTFFVIIFFSLVIYCVIKFWQAHKSSSGIKKAQVKYFLLAAIVGFSGGAFSFLPVYQIDLYPFLNGSIVVSILITTYAIFKYRFMNIRRIISRSILYFLLVSVITSVFAFTAFFSGEIIQTSGRYSRLLIFMIVSFVVVLSLDPLKKFLARITDDIFFKDRIDYQAVLRDMSVIIAREIDLETLLGSLRTAMMTKLKLKAADVLVKKDEHYRSFTTAGGKEFESGSPLFGYLLEHKNIIITDEFYRETFDMPEGEQRHRKQQALDELERQGIEFCMPVFLEGEMRAVIILGQKQSGDVYGTDEVRFFSSLSPQIAVAIEKSQLYESIGEFNLKLQDKINQATRQLKDTNLALQDANAHLKQLDTAKSEFLSIASHQLRTPISALKGYLSMLMEGDFGTVPDKQRQVIGGLFESSSRLARLINTFLNVSRIESGRFKLDKTTVDINELTQGVVKELTGQANMKKLELIFKPMSNLPKLFLDSDKIREVILNLIDNSIKYTQKGSITVETVLDRNGFHFICKDTGVGIQPEDAESLFRKFVRGTGIAQVNTTGSGLGLYIAQRVISEHGGRIWVESEGVGKGSAFHFVVPIIEPPKQAKPEQKGKNDGKPSASVRSAIGDSITKQS